MDATLMFEPLRGLAKRIHDQKLSPVELTETSLDRLEKIGPQLNAVVTVMRESAMEEARAAEREIKDGRYRGLLHGIPYGVKDLVATKGVPTTWGAAPYRDQVFDYDATIVERLRDAGAVLVAKLAMVELAGGMGYDEADASFTGPGLCPWNVKFWSGGSSSGPGAAVSAGLVPFAIGSETSGSILTPAAFCGVTGLRPTYGMVSRHGAMALSWTLDKLGPMCRTSDCTGIVLAAIAGKDERDPSASDRGFSYPEAILPGDDMRIAIIKGVTDKVQPAVKTNFDKAIDVLQSVAQVSTDVEWPDFPWGPSVGTIVGAEGAAAFVDLIESGRVNELTCKRDKRGGYAGMMIPAVDYLQAMRVRAPMKRAVNELFEKFDAVVAPTRASVAPPIDKPFREAYPGISGGPPLIAAGNLCGLPALCLPNGFGENWLPTSISLMGKAFSEDKLIRLGNAFQRATIWHVRRPNVG